MGALLCVHRGQENHLVMLFVCLDDKSLPLSILSAFIYTQNEPAAFSNNLTPPRWLPFE